MPSKKKNRKGLLSDDQIDMAAGAFSGAVATGLTHPLDTLSVRAQADESDNMKKPGRIFKRKGVDVGELKKLYRGIGPKLTKTIPAGAAGYWAYGAAKRNLHNTVGPEEIEKNSAVRKYIDNYGREKTANPLAALGAAAKFVPKAAKGLGDFAKSFGSAGANFAKGFTGTGKFNLKSPAYTAGLGTTLSIPRKFNKSKPLSQYGKYSPTAKVKGIDMGRTNNVG